jgi:hypothetical protein
MVVGLPVEPMGSWSSQFDKLKLVPGGTLLLSGPAGSCEPGYAPPEPAVGAAVGVGAAVALGDAVGVGASVGVAVALGEDVGAGDGDAVGATVAFGEAVGEGAAVGGAVGEPVGAVPLPMKSCALVGAPTE